MVVDLPTLGFFLVVVAASFFMAWTIGAGSAGSTPFAPAVGANAISVMQASFVVGILVLLGAVLQGANVSEAVGRELISGVELSILGATVALVIAAVLVMVGIFSGYPISTAFTVTGAVIGVGLGLGGDPAWAKYLEISTLWILTPFVGGGAAYGLAIGLRRSGAYERRAVGFLGGVIGILIANIEFAFLGPADGGDSLAGAIATHLPIEPLIPLTLVSITLGAFGWLAVDYGMRGDISRGERSFTLVLGGIVAFSAGGSQVGLAIGPLVPIFDEIVPLLIILVGGGIGLLAGAWTAAPRLLKALSQDYTGLGPRRSIAALIPSFVIAQVAILFGIPISFNQIIVSAIVGAGAAASASESVSGRKFLWTIVAWTTSFVVALVFGYGVMILLQSVT